MAVRSIIFILFISCFQQQPYAQKVEPKFSFNVELGLPVSVANEPFDDVMQGLISASVYGQYSFPFHLNVGLGVKYALFNVNEFAIQPAVQGNLQTGAAFVKVGWDKFITDRFAIDLSVKAGYSQAYANSDALEENGVRYEKRDAFILEPTLGLILSANQANSYRWVLGWNMQGYGFSPQMVGYDSDKGYDPAGFNNITQFLVVGFGYTHYIGAKKD